MPARAGTTCVFRPLWVGSQRAAGSPGRPMAVVPPALLTPSPICVKREQNLLLEGMTLAANRELAGT